MTGMVEEKILTKHPEGKRGVNVSKSKYDVVREAILECFQSKELTHTELTKAVEEKLEGRLEGSIPGISKSLSSILKQEALWREFETLNRSVTE